MHYCMQPLDTIILDFVLGANLFCIVANVFNICIVIKKVCNTVWLVKLSPSFKFNLSFNMYGNNLGWGIYTMFL